ncbi:MAG: SdpI family protein [Syntrophobacteraceae bacterium]|jgi:uncharacterized membrane protein
MSVFEKGLITICAVCALSGLISLPLIFRKVPPNRVYGYRTRAALSDDSLWCAVNARFGWCLLLASIFAAIAALALDMWRTSPEAYLELSILLLIAPAIIAGILTSRFIRSRATGERSNGRRY